MKDLVTKESCWCETHTLFMKSSFQTNLPPSLPLFPPSLFVDNHSSYLDYPSFLHKNLEAPSRLSKKSQLLINTGGSHQHKDLLQLR